MYLQRGAERVYSVMVIKSLGACLLREKDEAKNSAAQSL